MEIIYALCCQANRLFNGIRWIEAKRDWCLRMPDGSFREVVCCPWCMTIMADLEKPRNVKRTPSP